MAKKLSTKDSFDQVFATKNKYFGEWFLKSDETLYDFINGYQNESGIDLLKQIRYLYLYFESLEILKIQGDKKEFAIANLMSRELWYCNILLLLIGLIDQHTKDELNSDGKLPNLGHRFKIVMQSLEVSEQNHMLQHYGGPKKYQVFKDLVMHIYSTRTFFAHEIIQPDNSISQDGYLAFGSGKNMNTMYPNMPHGRLFLYIVKAFLRYIGFEKEIDVKSEEKFDKLSDFIRKT